MKKVSIFLIIFLSNFLIMTLEMLGIRSISSEFGNALSTQAGVIGLVFFAISCGYILHSKFREKFSKKNNLDLIQIISIIYTAVVIIIYKQSIIDTIFLSREYITNIYLKEIIPPYLTAFTLYFIPVMVLSLLSVSYSKYLLASHKKTNGDVDISNYLLISTFGGLVGLFLPSFLLIPFLGLSGSYIFVLFLQLVILFLNGLSRNKFFLTVVLIVISIMSYSERYGFSSKYSSIDIKENGNVLDYKISKWVSYTKFDKEDPLRITHTLGSIVPFLDSSPQKILVLGVAGLTSVVQLQILLPNAKITAVDIDRELVEHANKLIPEKYNTRNVDYVYSDARVFLKENKMNKYDLILVDVFSSVVPPLHCLTNEFFKLIKSNLTKNGMANINLGVESFFYETKNVVADMPFRKIVSTLKASGFSNIFYNTYTKHFHLFNNRNNDFLVNIKKNVSREDISLGMRVASQVTLLNSLKLNLENYKYQILTDDNVTDMFYQNLNSRKFREIISKELFGDVENVIANISLKYTIYENDKNNEQYFLELEEHLPISQLNLARYLIINRYKLVSMKRDRFSSIQNFYHFIKIGEIEKADKIFKNIEKYVIF